MPASTARCGCPAMRPAFAVVFALAPFVTGCASVTLDLTRIDEPVMLNELPYSGASWSATHVDQFFSNVSHATGGSSQPGTNTSRSTEILENDAQVKAFEAIGGHSHRAIGVEKIEVWGGGANMLIVFMELAEVSIRGAVVEIRGAAPGAEGSR